MNWQSPSSGPQVVYRAVLLAAGLLLFGLLFRQLVTLLLAMLVTVILAIPLAAAATRLERYKIPRVAGALIALLGGIGVLVLVIYLLIPPFVDQTNQFVDDVPAIVKDLERVYADVTGTPRPPIERARAGITWCEPFEDRWAAREDGMSRIEWIKWVLRADAVSGVDLSDPKPLILGSLWPKARHKLGEQWNRLVRRSRTLPSR